ncbi:amidohydrolase [Phenylobacterium sp.]|uniref:amidohydrolase n=1 Tax=Phenylobacterium sp. TaxID=1871053 RepID=UPI0035B4E021
MVGTVIFEARNIVTLDPRAPTATHVAVRDGRILGVGALDDLTGWGDHVLDRTFADKVLAPGFVEGHAHMMTGGLWRYIYVGHIDRVDPDGKPWPALRDLDGVVERMKAVAPQVPADMPVMGWGFDPLFVDGPRLTRQDLDRVSTDRPVLVFHSSLHLVTANSAALAAVGYDRTTNAEGVIKGADGEPNGELQEFGAIVPMFRRLGIDIEGVAKGAEAMRGFAESARRAGVTTITDLGRSLVDADVAELLAFTRREDCPIRIAALLLSQFKPIDALVADSRAYAAKSTDKLRLGVVKIVVDGSIQGYTAQIRWPGYYKGVAHGFWNIAPEQLDDMVERLNAAGVQMHIHTNGDEATEVALDALEKALAKNPYPDHRHTLQHCQMASLGQYRRIKALGLCVNLFANHIYHFGDKHYETTLGPDRAHRMNACGTATEMGVPLAIHSDTPVTPLAPLFTAWCAVNRITESGRILGPTERLDVTTALKAISLGPAYTLHMDDEIGSIEVGKRADFAVLEDDPLALPPEALKDIGVVGTVLGGRPMLEPTP